MMHRAIARPGPVINEPRALVNQTRSYPLLLHQNIGSGGSTVKSVAIAASIIVALAGPAVAKGDAGSQTDSQPICSGFGLQARHIVYSSQSANGCCGDTLPCAQYLATTVVPRPNLPRRT
jgi:hypothetical protein